MSLDAQHVSRHAEAAAIEVDGLAKSFGSVRALDGVSFRVQRGEVYGFLGPNGAGKSTAIRILLDLIRPTGGSARVLGYDSQRESIEVRRRVGYLPGDLVLYRGMDVDAFLNLMSRFRADRYDPRFRADLMERLGVPRGRHVDALSKGQRQKVGLVQALMSRPEVLILDEPTEGLDPIMRSTVLGLLRELAAGGSTIFFSSHVLAEAEAVCKRVALLSGGRLLDVIDVAEARRNAPRRVRLEFTEPAGDLFAGIDGVRVDLASGGTVELTASEPALDAIVKAAATRSLRDIQVRAPTLQDLVLPLYAQSGTRLEREDPVHVAHP